jgi:L-aminopeptidase/D-esterase-like protein
VGAGVGASVGKVWGLRHASKGGLGSAGFVGKDGLIVAALVVVNAFGNVYDPQTGRAIAGARRLDAEGRCLGFVDPVEAMAAGTGPTFAGANTTLAVVATNAQLSKSGAAKVAQMAHDGLARVIRPLHTSIDGDVVFALSCGEHAAAADLVGALAADAAAQAVVQAVLAAESCYGLPCARDLQGG